jgi:hypothetical protein
MANTTAISNQFRTNVLTTGFNLNTKTLKGALYYAASTVNATTPSYTSTGEVTLGSYVAGGSSVTNAVAVAGANTTVGGDTYYWTPSAPITWTTVSITAFDTVMIYDAVTPFNSIGTWNFGTQTVTAGNVTLSMPANAAGTALVRLL